MQGVVLATDVAERLGVHRITINRWLKQYSVGGLPAPLKRGKSTGRHRVISQFLIAELSEKLSEKFCNLKKYR